MPPPVANSGSPEVDTSWPAHDRQVRAWQQSSRGGTRDDRELREIIVSIPPRIAHRTPVVDAALSADMERALREITQLDRDHGGDLAALGVLLVRTESVASSKIEHVEASVDDYARALHGIRTNPSAVSMVAATGALELLVDRVGREAWIQLNLVLEAHRLLMRDDHAESRYAGQLREVQSWIGGSDHSPRGALHVPPPPETVPDHMTDLLAFVNRDDLPVLVQAGIAHAQLESIHPFTDGNGRIGRALVNTVLRRRGATTAVVVPLASALVAQRERYFADLDSYRAGDPRPIVEAFTTASLVAAREARVSAARLAEIPVVWREAVGRVRRGSATSRLLVLLPASPVLSAEDACSLLPTSPDSSVYAAIARLHEAGILRPLTGRKRNQVWGAASVLDELDDLGVRIAAAAR